MYDQVLRKYKNIKLYITGYGIFEGVSENPSELLVKKIEENKEKICSQLGKGIEFHHSEIFKVAIQEVKEKTKEIYSKLSQNLNDQDEMQLIIHFGVHSGSKNICLESQCVNKFSGADVDGCTINGKINKDDIDSYKCKLDLSLIHSEIEKSHKVAISNDAGDYLCNFVYYLSCTQWHNEKNVFPIFIHIPDLKTINLEDIFLCFVGFLESVKKQYCIV